MTYLRNEQRMTRFKSCRITKILKDSLPRMHNEFDPGVLADKLLTHKNERELLATLRDCMKKHDEASQMEVVCEWEATGSGNKNKYDLAVLDDDSLVAIVEAKLWRSYDIQKWCDNEYGHQNSKTKTIADIVKLQSFKFSTNCYLLSLCAHFHDIPPQKYHDKIKYIENIKRTPKDTSRIEMGYENLEREWGNLPKVCQGEIKAGHAKGVDVSLYFRLYEVL